MRSHACYLVDREDLCEIIDLVTLETCAVYFNDGEFALHHVKLKVSKLQNGYDFHPNPLLMDQLMVMFPLRTAEEREWEEESYLNWKN